MNGRRDRGPALRLSPEMASFRLLVLKFVRAYIGEWGCSPSYGEIAAALDSNRTRVRKAVKSLVRGGLLLRQAGERGLALPAEAETAKRVLRALGWRIDERGHAAAAPVTKRPLLPPPALDYPPIHGEKAQQGEADGHPGP